MSFQPHAFLRRVRGLPAQVHDLGEHLQRLSSRVRESVAEATGQTVAQVVKEVLTRAFSGRPILQTLQDVRQPFDPYGWPDEDSDPWAVERPGWDRSEPRHSPIHVDEQRSPKPMIGLTALALHAGGWWLRRRGSRFGVLGLGLLFGGAALLGGRIALTGLGLVETAGELLALDHLLTSSGQSLSAV